MQQFPHLYHVSASVEGDADVLLDNPSLPPLHSAPPAEFGGPGDRWSPETLLVASVADCLILSFRSVARARKLEWTSLDVQVEGKLERVDRVTRFTEFVVAAVLLVPEATDQEAAREAVERAENLCLIRNSLNATFQLDTQVVSCPSQAKSVRPSDGKFVSAPGPVN